MSREYSRVSCTFWTRGSGKLLRGQGDAQRVALYLFSCPAGNMVGLFHLALPTLLHEIGIGMVEALVALGRLASLDVAHYDDAEEIVWLPMAPPHQLGKAQLSPADKRIDAIVREISPFVGHRFHTAFMARWAVALSLPGSDESWGEKLRAIRTMPDAPSATVPTMPDAPSTRAADILPQGASAIVPTVPDAPPKGHPENDHDPGGAGAGAGADTKEVASPSASHLSPVLQDSTGPAKTKREKPPREPLPFRAAEALAAVKAAAGARFAFSPDLLSKGYAISVESLIRKRPDLATWARLGEWLASPANAWHEAPFDVAAILAKPSMLDAAGEWQAKPSASVHPSHRPYPPEATR